MDSFNELTIVATIPDTHEVVIYWVRANLDVDPVEAIKKAAKEYVSSPEGKKECKDDNISAFNWGDAINHLPDDLLKRHGILSFNTIRDPRQCRLVDHDEELAKVED